MYVNKTFPPTRTSVVCVCLLTADRNRSYVLYVRVRAGPAAAERRQDGGTGRPEARRRLRRRAGAAGGVRGVAVRPGAGDVAAVHDRGACVPLVSCRRQVVAITPTHRSISSGRSPYRLRDARVCFRSTLLPTRSVFFFVSVSGAASLVVV
jgi:hypothetical protein